MIMTMTILLLISNGVYVETILAIMILVMSMLAVMLLEVIKKMMLGNLVILI